MRYPPLRIARGTWTESSVIERATHLDGVVRNLGINARIRRSVWHQVHNRQNRNSSLLTPSDEFSERRPQLPGLPVPVLSFRRTGRRGREVSTKPDRER
jgi:hypothetical protein